MWTRFGSCKFIPSKCWLEKFFSSKVFDFSTTTEPVYKDYIRLGEQLVSQLYVSPRHTRVALVTFSSPGKTHTHFDLKQYKTGEQVDFWKISKLKLKDL